MHNKPVNIYKTDNHAHQNDREGLVRRIVRILTVIFQIVGIISGAAIGAVAPAALYFFCVGQDNVDGGLVAALCVFGNATGYIGLKLSMWILFRNELPEFGSSYPNSANANCPSVGEKGKQP